MGRYLAGSRGDDHSTRVTCMVCQLLPYSNNEFPAAAMVTVYSVWSATAETMFSWLPSVMINLSELSPGTIIYVGFCLSKKAFWADMIPTTPGTSASSMDMLSIVTYQLPRFWLKEVAESNIPVMLVTEETSQDDMSWLKEVAFRNIQFMIVADETSQELSGWLKEEAL